MSAPLSTSSYARCLLIPVLLLPLTAIADDWAVYDSENFEVYSDARESRVRTLVEALEEIRNTALALLKAPGIPDARRARIFIFDRTGEYNRVNRGRLALGTYYDLVFGPTILVGPQTFEELQEALFFQYTGYLLDSRFAVNFPPWYQLGFAQLMSTAERQRDSIIIGSPPRYISLGAAFSLRESVSMESCCDSVSSWLMVHYSLIDSIEDSGRALQTADYIRRFDAGEDPVEAFVESYGVSPEDMGRTLNSYRVIGRFSRIGYTGARYLGQINRRPLERSEELYILGDLAVERASYEAARDYFDEFERLNIGSPFADNVMSRRAIAYLAEERVGEGDAMVESLLAGRPEEPDVLADIARYEYIRHLYEQYISDTQPANQEATNVSGSGYLQRSIESGERAVAANPYDVEALAYLGVAYETKGDLQRSTDTLLNFYDIDPSEPVINLILARVLIKGGRTELASYLITRVYSATYSVERRRRLREIQEQIEDTDAVLDLIDKLIY